MTCLGPPQLRRPRSNLLIAPFTNRLNNYFMGKGPPLNFNASQENYKIPQAMQTKNSITVFRKITTDLYAVDPSGSAVSVVGLVLLSCWNCGFESRRFHGYLYLATVVCCQVETSTPG